MRKFKNVDKDLLKIKLKENKRFTAQDTRKGKKRNMN